MEEIDGDAPAQRQLREGRPTLVISSNTFSHFYFSISYEVIRSVR